MKRILISMRLLGRYVIARQNGGRQANSKQEFFAGYPGFDAFSTSVNQTIFQDAVRTQLTQALGIILGIIGSEIVKLTSAQLSQLNRSARRHPTR
tara:strand:- start:1323 stop:1607 length:285 start_codon:yes stop_codon:yes gene_type:complete